MSHSEVLLHILVGVETRENSFMWFKCAGDCDRWIHGTCRLNGQHLSFRFKWKLILLCVRILVDLLGLFRPLCLLNLLNCVHKINFIANFSSFSLYR